MEYNQDLTVAYITVKVNGGTNVLRNIFHFNSEAIEDAFRNEFNDMARLTDFVAVSAAQMGASISYAEERAVLTLGLVLDIECDESSNNFDYAKSLLSIVYPEQFVKELSQATTMNRSPYNSYIKNLTITHEHANFALPLTKARV